MILKKCHFCPKTAIVSKMCKDQDRGQGAKIFCWSKYACMLYTSTMGEEGLQTTCDNFDDFNIGFQNHPDPPTPNIS